MSKTVPGSPPTQHDLVRTVPATRADLVPQDVTAHEVERKTRGRWVVWFGHRTGRFWAMVRPRGPVKRSLGQLVEAETVEALWSQMIEVDAFDGVRPDGSWR